MFPRDIVCLRNMSINTLHKGDDDDDNNNTKETCMLIDVAIPGDRNVIKKEVEKILKYKNLITEVIPVIIGNTETISKSLNALATYQANAK